VGVEEGRPKIIGRALVFSYETFRVDNNATNGDEVDDSKLGNVANLSNKSDEDGEPVHEDRVGSDVNRLQITLLLELLGFEVHVYVDSTAEQTKHTVTEFCAEQSALGLFTCVVMSHGVTSQRAIHGSRDDLFAASDNAPLSLSEDITRPLYGSLSLRDAVKIFVVNVCRESDSTSAGDTIMGDDFNDNDNDNDCDATNSLEHVSPLISASDGHTQLRLSPNNLMAHSHCITLHSTLPSLYSYRSSHSGALFIDSFVRALSTHRHCEVMHIVKECNSNLREVCSENHQLFQAMAVDLQDIRRDVYFIPNVSFVCNLLVLLIKIKCCRSISQ
jgi:hypothetical protein